MPTYLPYADLDRKLEQERARLTGRLRALADALDHASVERLADVLPLVSTPLKTMVRLVPRRLLYLTLSTDPGATR